jgi:acyl-CoA synthetase (AMP-forming)/AMP-acid ligase II
MAVWRGEKPAVIEGETGRTLTYRELIERVERVAAGLSRTGLRPGQPVAVALPNTIDFVLAWYGALRAGAWVVPINPAYTPGEMEFQIRDSGARYLIAASDRARALEAVVERSFDCDGSWKQLLESEGAPPEVCITPTDIAALPYSSGTTGKPKGVILTHSNLVSNTRQVYATGHLRAEEVVVNMMPVYHAAGLNYLINGMLGIGATIVLMRRFVLQEWLTLMERYHATLVVAPPPVILAVTKSPLWDRFRLDKVRCAISGAAPLGADLQRAFEQRTGLTLGQAWGMTEATAIIAITPDDRERRKLGSCGYLLPSSEARVIDVASGKELLAGETGEIWLRGPQIMQGYWNEPQATTETLAGDGWMRTGDIGYFDADGCVFLVDRLKELIKYKALQVAPAELEDVIQSHPAVLDAAVVGTPDPEAGEIPMAFVVRRQGMALDAQELMHYVAARVAPHKKIRGVEFVTQVPRSPTGKILRRVLKQMVAELRP